MIKRIHVNQHAIKRNLVDGGYRPVITVKTYKDNTYGHRVEIQGPSSIVYPEKPMKCGARVWIETEAPVKIFEKTGKVSYKLIKEIL